MSESATALPRQDGEERQGGGSQRPRRPHGRRNPKGVRFGRSIHPVHDSAGLRSRRPREATRAERRETAKCNRPITQSPLAFCFPVCGGRRTNRTLRLRTASSSRVGTVGLPRESFPGGGSPSGAFGFGSVVRRAGRSRLGALMARGDSHASRSEAGVTRSPLFPPRSCQTATECV